MEKNLKMYAVLRGNLWLNSNNRWDIQSCRKLFKSKTGVFRALNEADNVGVTPVDPFKVALSCPDTKIVSVFVKVTEIEVEYVPVKVKIKKFKCRVSREKWYPKGSQEGDMAVYDVDAMPGFRGYC